VGRRVGRGVGLGEGFAVGGDVGRRVGRGVGLGEGFGEGEDVGSLVEGLVDGTCAYVSTALRDCIMVRTMWMRFTLIMIRYGFVSIAIF
jgi:hypothetical protein